jgi:hypothetical protein
MIRVKTARRLSGPVPASLEMMRFRMGSGICGTSGIRMTHI